MNVSSGMHIFAMRIMLEGGSTICEDNGGTPSNGVSMEVGPFDPISAFGFAK